MSVILGIIFLVLVFNIKIHKDIYASYIDKRQTANINGIFVILVFLSHFSQYVELGGKWDIVFIVCKHMLGQLVVTTFLFYSGYGVMYSIMNKKDYINRMLSERILKTLVLFDGAIIVYILINLFLKNDMTMKQIMLAFIGWESVGNSTWYIFAILIMYLITYLTFKILRNASTFTKLLITSLFICVYILVIREWKESQYYNTVMCYAMGLWYAYYKEKIDMLVSDKKIYRLLFVLSGIGFAITIIFREANLAINQAYYLMFVLWIVLISMKVEINSLILGWCGRNVFGIYIFQRLPMLVLIKNNWMASNVYVYLIICIVVTVILVKVYHWLAIKNIENYFIKSMKWR